MKQRELIEIIQQHHAKMGYKEIRLALNRVQNDYCARTELIKTIAKKYDLCLHIY